MPALAEVQLAIGGALRLARGDRGGLDCFDASIDGFWRSFRAALIVLPALSDPAELSGRARRRRGREVDAGAILRGRDHRTTSISWVAFPLVVLPLGRWLRPRRPLSRASWSPTTGAQVPQTVRVRRWSRSWAAPASCRLGDAQRRFDRSASRRSSTSGTSPASRWRSPARRRRWSSSCDLVLGRVLSRSQPGALLTPSVVATCDRDRAPRPARSGRRRGGRAPRAPRRRPRAATGRARPASGCPTMLRT